METLSSLSSAVAELIVLEPEYLNIGVPGSVLEKYVLSREEYTKNSLDECLLKELERETLLRLDNGNYFLGPKPEGKGPEIPSLPPSASSSRPSSTSPKPQMDVSEDPKKDSASGDSSPESKPENSAKKPKLEPIESPTETVILERSSRKRTKNKPSDYYFPSLTRKSKDPLLDKISPEKAMPVKKKKAARPAKKKTTKAAAQAKASSSRSSPNKDQISLHLEETVCAICSSNSPTRNSQGFVTCFSCYNRAHDGCIEKEGGIPERWYCPDCRNESKSCLICDSSKGSLVTCDFCCESFHLDCHEPPLQPEVLNRSGFTCFKCPMKPSSTSVHGSVSGERDSVTSSSSNSDVAGRTSSSSPPVSKTDDVSENSVVIKTEVVDDDDDRDAEIPDPTRWSSGDVYEYFANHFEQKIAAAFQEQDIDGQSLLLMQRSDVLNGLGFKLGVALRVLYHVKKLQLQKSDLKLLWTS